MALSCCCDVPLENYMMWAIKYYEMIMISLYHTELARSLIQAHRHCHRHSHRRHYPVSRQQETHLQLLFTSVYVIHLCMFVCTFPVIINLKFLIFIVFISVLWLLLEIALIQLILLWVWSFSVPTKALFPLLRHKRSSYCCPCPLEFTRFT